MVNLLLTDARFNVAWISNIEGASLLMLSIDAEEVGLQCKTTIPTILWCILSGSALEHSSSPKAAQGVLGAVLVALGAASAPAPLQWLPTVPWCQLPAGTTGGGEAFGVFLSNQTQGGSSLMWNERKLVSEGHPWEHIFYFKWRAHVMRASDAIGREWWACCHGNCAFYLNSKINNCLKPPWCVWRLGLFVMYILWEGIWWILQENKIPVDALCWSQPTSNTAKRYINAMA